MSEAPGKKVDAEVEDKHWETKDGEKWVVLACVPHVVRGDYFKQGVENAIKAAIAPRATRLVVHRSIAPRLKTIDDHPYVAGADSHGRLLLYATQGPEPEPPVLDAFDSKKLGVHHGFPKAYFICDTRTHEYTRLTDHGRQGFPIFHPGNVGLASITKDMYVVADLHPTAGADKAALLVYFSVPENWTVHEVDYPPRHRPWGGNGVVVHETMIWWVDLSYGLLACDLRITRHNLRFVPLPEGCEMPPGTPCLDKRRCMGFRGGDLRYVQIHERDGKPIVSMWTLIDHQRAGTWRLDCQALVKDIWDDEGYKATKLPREVPTVALIHPEHPGDVAYFFMHSRLFGVDLRACRILEWQFFEMLNPPMAYHSSRFVRAWKRSSCSALDDSAGSDDKKKDAPPVSTSKSAKRRGFRNPRRRDRKQRPDTSSQ